MALLWVAAAHAALPWQPPTPPADDFDWIQLKSGEWLKGRIKGMEFERIEFDSEKLNLLTFDVDDVVFIRSPRTFDILRTDRTVVSGPIEIDLVAVKIAGQTIPRAEIKAFSLRGTRELQLWSGELSAGAIVRAGNTDTLDVTYHAGVTRRTAATRLEVEYTQTLSQTDGVDTADSRRGSLEFDTFTSQRTFVRLPSVEYLQDRFQNLSNRTTVGASVGYDIIQLGKRHWDVTIGPAWQRTEFYSVQPGEDLDKQTGALVFTSHFETDVTQDVTFTIDYRGQFTKKEVGENVHHAEAQLEVDLTKRLELDATFTWDRIANPKENEAGVVPKPDDYRLSLALSVQL